jgi:hypothetical protein
VSVTGGTTEACVFEWFGYSTGESFMGILNLFSGSKTYFAAIGLVGLAVYQATTGDYTQAIQSLMGALAAAGLRSAIANQTSQSPAA